MIRITLWLLAVAGAAAVALVVTSARVGEHRSSTFGEQFKAFQTSWGGAIDVHPPAFFFRRLTPRPNEEPTEKREPLTPRAINVAAQIDFAEQRHGWLTFNAFEARSTEEYSVGNPTSRTDELFVQIDRPAGASVLTDVRFRVVGAETPPLRFGHPVRIAASFRPGQIVSVYLSYRVRGMDVFRYVLSNYQDDVVERLKAELSTNTPRFRLFHFGLPHTTSSGGGRHIVRFESSGLSAKQDAGMVFYEHAHLLERVESLLAASPVAPALFLTVVFLFAQMGGHRLNPLHYFFLAAIVVFYYIFVAYLIRFVGIWATVTTSVALTGALFSVYCIPVLGRRFALGTAAPAAAALTLGLTLIFMMPIFRGLLFVTMLFAIVLIVMWRVGRSDIDSWPVWEGKRPG